MPVHNGEPYLDASIRSMIDQTFPDFEFVILDDASSDRSPETLREWARRDGRIRLLESPTPLGLAGSADRVVREARAPICARMDADDISHPDRLRMQFEVLEAHPDVALVGTLWEGIDAGGRTVRPRDRWRLARSSPFAPFPHGSIMFRRDLFLEAGGYREACAFWEDLDLYYRMAERGRILVLPDALYRYRFHAESTWTRVSFERVTRAADLMHRCVAVRRAGRDYAPLLEAGPERIDGGVSLRALYSVGSSRLWAGHSPKMLRVFRRLHLRPGGGAPTAFMLGVWGALSPSTLRSVLRGFIRLRDRLVSRAFSDGVPVEWRSG